MFRAYVAVSAVLVGCYPVVADRGWLGTAWQTLIGFGAAAMAVLSVRRYRPAGGAAWLCFAAGILLNTAGQAVNETLTIPNTNDSVTVKFDTAANVTTFQALSTFRRAH